MTFIRQRPRHRAGSQRIVKVLARRPQRNPAAGGVAARLLRSPHGGTAWGVPLPWEA